LHINNYINLYFAEKKRDIEVDVVSAADMSISLDQGVTTPALPTSLKLMQSVDVSNVCWSVFRYENNTYVGLKGGIVRMDESYNVTRSFAAVHENVLSHASYKNRLYALVRVGSYNWKVIVYDFRGNQVTSWLYSDDSGYSNTLAIVDGQIAVSDKQRKRLTIYSLTGKVIKHVPCSLLGNCYIIICPADRQCVVVSDYKFSQVLKLNLTTEKVIWTCKDVTNPEGVTFYRSKYILVTNCSKKTTIWILDVKTG